MSRLVYGLDASEYTGEIPRSTFKHLYEGGYRIFLPQIWGGGYDRNRANRHLRQHVLAARAEGFHVSVGYVWPPADIGMALTFLAEQRVKLRSIALDVEAGAILWHTNVTTVRNAGMNPIIYTGSWAWRSIMGLDSSFSDVDLWVARYPYIRHNAYDPTHIQTELEGCRPLFGGWTLDKVIAWQFQNTTDMWGEQFDLNLCREEAFMTPSAEVERLEALQTVMALFMEAAATAGQGKQPSPEVRDQIKYLVASWR